MNKNELIKLEAKMLITKHLIGATEDLITERNQIKATRTGHHDTEVEDVAIKILSRKVKTMKKNLAELIKQHSYLPYTELALQYLKKGERA
jgi:hypothetical protein